MVLKYKWRRSGLFVKEEEDDDDDDDVPAPVPVPALPRRRLAAGGDAAAGLLWLAVEAVAAAPNGLMAAESPVVAEEEDITTPAKGFDVSGAALVVAVGGAEKGLEAAGVLVVVAPPEKGLEGAVEEEAEEPAPDTPVKGFEPEEEDGGEAVARESDAGFEEVEEDTPENGLEAALLVPDDKPLNGLLAAALALLEDAAPPNGLLDDDLAGLAPNTSTVEEEAPRGPASLDFLVEVAEP